MHHMSARFRGIGSERGVSCGRQAITKPEFKKPAVSGPFVSSWIIIQTMTTELMKDRIVSSFSATNSAAANGFWRAEM